MPARRPAIALLEECPWLGSGLAEDELVAARRTLRVPLHTAPTGPWSWEGAPPAVGLLIVGGLMARGLYVEDVPAHGIELIGDGDLLRPWTFRGQSGSLPSTAEWVALAPPRLAVLDETYVQATARWPLIGINLLESAVERTRTLSYFLTARQVPKLELRILLTLWHLADRWGHVSSSGVILELPMVTHAMLARMVAARRPSVTTAVRRLREVGAVDVPTPGCWVLLVAPQEALRLIGAPRVGRGDEADAGSPSRGGLGGDASG